MKLNFAIVCENAFVDEQQRLTIVQTFNRIIAEKLPALHSKLTIATSYTLKEKERNKKYTQTVEISNPSNTLIAKLKVVTKKEKQGKKMQFIGYFYNLPIDEKGIYKIKISLDGNLQEKLELEVIEK